VLNFVRKKRRLYNKKIVYFSNELFELNEGIKDVLEKLVTDIEGYHCRIGVDIYDSNAIYYI